jgi:hypothetical protein
VTLVTVIVVHKRYGAMSGESVHWHDGYHGQYSREDDAMEPISPLFFSAALGVPLFALVFILSMLDKHHIPHER